MATPITSNHRGLETHTSDPVLSKAYRTLIKELVPLYAEFGGEGNKFGRDIPSRLAARHNIVISLSKFVDAWLEECMDDITTSFSNEYDWNWMYAFSFCIAQDFSEADLITAYAVHDNAAHHYISGTTTFHLDLLTFFTDAKSKSGRSGTELINSAITSLLAISIPHNKYNRYNDF